MDHKSKIGLDKNIMDHCENHYNLENRLDNIPDTSKLHIHFFGILGFLTGVLWETIFRGLN